MKVIKFGGSSVGTQESILKVKSIICSQNETSITVVSALGGVTDSLISVSSLAEKGDRSFMEKLEELSERHFKMCDLVVDAKRRDSVKAELLEMMERLKNLCEGVCLLGVLPSKVYDEIMSLGERMSSLILSAMLPSAVIYDSLSFIKTTRIQNNDVADNESSYSLIRKTFKDYDSSSAFAVVPGFISTDVKTGEITDLARGGSDFTASLIAAALDADVLEIWTDVDGFMTADPRIIKTSYVIDEMNYEEAMELCNFGAKVVYPPTLYAVCKK